MSLKKFEATLNKWAENNEQLLTHKIHNFFFLKKEKAHNPETTDRMHHLDLAIRLKGHANTAKKKNHEKDFVEFERLVQQQLEKAFPSCQNQG